MEQTNYVSVRKLTREEAFEVYSKLSKERLIEMLIACNEALDAALLGTPSQMYPIQAPAHTGYYDCSDWKHCKNPYRDCIGCPLSVGGGNSYTITSTDTIGTSKFVGNKQNE